MAVSAVPGPREVRAVRRGVAGVWAWILSSWLLLQGCASVPKAPVTTPRAPDRLLRRVEAPGEQPVPGEIEQLEARTGRIDNKNQNEDLLRLAFLYLRQRQPDRALSACYRVKYGGDRLPAEVEDVAHLLIARAHLQANDPDRANHFAHLAETQSQDAEVVASARELLQRLAREGGEPRLPRATAQARQRPAALVPVAALGRDRWGAAPPRTQLMEPMGTVRRITVHHSGIPSVGADEASSGRMVRSIQRTHMQKEHWGDIGYHYLIDAAGRVWNGRSVTMQGAHAGDNQTNRGNIGICLLGDFEQGAPTKAQWDTLEQLVRYLMQRHSLAAGSLVTHQEIRPSAKGATACPGRRLQGMVERLRADLRS